MRKHSKSQSYQPPMYETPINRKSQLHTVLVVPLLASAAVPAFQAGPAWPGTSREPTDPMNSFFFFKGKRAFLLPQLNFTHAGNLLFICTHTPLPLPSRVTFAQLPQENVPPFWPLFLPFVSQRKTALMMNDRFKVVPVIHPYGKKRSYIWRWESMS